MDYKELIDDLREKQHSFSCSSRYVDQTTSSILQNAVTAIETLLEEREAALEDLRQLGCATCKSIDIDLLEEPCFHCYQTGGMSDCWQWRGPTPPDREQKEEV